MFEPDWNIGNYSVSCEPHFFLEHVFGSTESGPGRKVYLITQNYVRSINSSMTSGMFVCTCNNITCCVAKQKARVSQKYQLKWQNGIKNISENCGFVYYSEKRVSNIFSVLMLFWYISLGFFFQLYFFFLLTIDA